MVPEAQYTCVVLNIVSNVSIISKSIDTSYIELPMYRIENFFSFHPQAASPYFVLLILF